MGQEPETALHTASRRNSGRVPMHRHRPGTRDRWRRSPRPRRAAAGMDPPAAGMDRSVVGMDQLVLGGKG